MYFVTFLFRQVFYTIGSIQSAAKAKNNFLPAPNDEFDEISFA